MIVLLCFSVVGCILRPSSDLFDQADSAAVSLFSGKGCSKRSQRSPVPDSLLRYLLPLPAYWHHCAAWSFLAETQFLRLVSAFSQEAARIPESQSHQNPQRIPFTLFAEILIPIPVVQITMPFSQVPSATAFAAACPNTG